MDSVAAAKSEFDLEAGFDQLSEAGQNLVNSFRNEFAGQAWFDKWFGASHQNAKKHFPDMDKAAWEIWVAETRNGKMMADPLMKWFFDLRKEVVHDGGNPDLFVSSTYINALAIGDLPSDVSIAIGSQGVTVTEGTGTAEERSRMATTESPGVETVSYETHTHVACPPDMHMGIILLNVSPVALATSFTQYLARLYADVCSIGLASGAISDVR